MPRRAALPAALLLALAVPAQALVVAIDAADPRFSRAERIAFDGLASGPATKIDIGPATFSAQGGALEIVPGAFGAAGPALSTFGLSWPYAFEIAFDAPLAAFGAALSAANKPWRAQAFAADGTALGAIEFAPAPGAPASGFLGLALEGAGASGGISRLVLSSLDGWDWLYLDDVLLAPAPRAALAVSSARAPAPPSPVPAPPALPLMALALAALWRMGRPARR